MTRADGVRWGVIIWAPGQGTESHLLELHPSASGLHKGPGQVWGCHLGPCGLQEGRLLAGVGVNTAHVVGWAVDLPGTYTDA